MTYKLRFLYAAKAAHPAGAVFATLRLADFYLALTASQTLIRGSLEPIQQLMIAEPSDAIRKLVICHIDQFPVLTRWQAELIDKLNKDADADPDAALLAALESLQPAADSEASESSLEFIQKHLFSAPDKKTSLDNSVQWLGVRDYLQEAEVAAGMAQQILSENPGLSTSEIGLLLPDTVEYSLAVNDAFTTAGVPLSGLPVDHWQRGVIPFLVLSPETFSCDGLGGLFVVSLDALDERAGCSVSSNSYGRRQPLTTIPVCHSV